MRESQLRWFVHVQCGSITALVRSDMVPLEGIRRKRGKLKSTWVEIVRKDMNANDSMEDMVLDK